MKWGLTSHQYNSTAIKVKEKGRNNTMLHGNLLLLNMQ